MTSQNTISQNLPEGIALTSSVQAQYGLPAIPAAVADYVSVQHVAGAVNKTTITVTDLPILITDALAYGSAKVLDFSQGQILILGATCSLQFAVYTAGNAVTTDRSTCITDDASLTFGVGSVAASAATLADTMVDMILKGTKVLDDDVTGQSLSSYTVAAQGIGSAASKLHDGSSSAVDAYLNLGLENGAHVAAAGGVIRVSGTIVIVYSYLGDY